MRHVLRTCRSESSGFANYFSDNGARSTVDPSKMVYRCEKFVLQPFELQDSEIEARWKTIDRITKNKRIQRISKVAHSSGRWTKFGVDIFFSFHSELLCSAENVWRQNAILSVSTGVYIYIKLKFRHSRGIISNQKSIVSDWQLEFVNQCDNHLELLPSDTWGVHLELLRVH